MCVCVCAGWCGGTPWPRLGQAWPGRSLGRVAVDQWERPREAFSDTFLCGCSILFIPSVPAFPVLLGRPVRAGRRGGGEGERRPGQPEKTAPTSAAAAAAAPGLCVCVCVYVQGVCVCACASLSPCPFPLDSDSQCGSVCDCDCACGTQPGLTDAA